MLNTVTGVGLTKLLSGFPTPLPSCPSLPLPQQATVPPAITAHLCSPPVETLATEPEITSVGTLTPLPQQYTLPAVVTAQVSLPAAAIVATLAKPLTSTGA
jgi:hypothetical protein